MHKVYGRDDHLIQTAVGEELKIQLGSNPTTGYQWRPEFNESALAVDEEPFQLHSHEGIGVGGTQRFTVRPLQAGNTTLRFQYVQPWAGEPDDTCEFKMDVQPSP